MKCIIISSLLAVISILSITLVIILYPSGFRIILNCGLGFRSILPIENTIFTGHSATDALNASARKPELISLRILTRRSRRDTNSAMVIQLIRSRRNEIMTAHVLENSKILSPDFVLFVDGRELDIESKVRSKRSAKVPMENLQTHFYTGVVSSESGSIGRIALTAYETSINELQGFFGLLSLDGVDYLIEPSSELGSAERGNGSHFLTEANGGTPGRKCATRQSRGPNMHDDTLALSAGEQLQPSEFNESQIFQGKVQVDAKSTPKKGIFVKTSSRVLELAVFADAALFKKMKKKFPTKTLQNSVTYILASVNNMQLMYKDPSIGYDNKLDIRLNYLEVLTKNPKKLNDAKGRENVYLDSFCKFAASKNTDVTNWDHAMMLTGTDLRAADSAGVLGVAFTGALCDNRYSCSLIEAANFLGTYTMTHELGHSLGMNHDGEENNKYCSPSKHIMAAIEGAGQLTWSICSQQNLRDFLNRRSAIPDASNPSCLRTTYSSRRKKKKPINYKKNRLPGEIYTASQQCAMSLGKSYNKPVYKTGYYESICYELKCGNGSKVVATQPALEGTVCGKQKWCKAGICVIKPANPPLNRG